MFERKPLNTIKIRRNDVKNQKKLSSCFFISGKTFLKIIFNPHELTNQGSLNLRAF